MIRNIQMCHALTGARREAHIDSRAIATPRANSRRHEATQKLILKYYLLNDSISRIAQATLPPFSCPCSLPLFPTHGIGNLFVATKNN